MPCHHPAGLSCRRSRTRDLPGLSLQHGWTCTRLGLFLLLTVARVKAHADLTSLLGFVAPVELLLRALSYELSDTRPMCVWFPRVL